jgi:hypothetical protein
MKNKKRNENHYVNNKEFSRAVHSYVEELNEARENNKPEPQIYEYIGECFIKLATRMGSKHNFRDYSWNDEMICDGIENCVKAINNYNIEAATRSGKPNAYGYFSRIIHFAFLRRIAKENRQLEKINKYIAASGIDQFSSNESNHDSSSIVERIKGRIETAKHI